MQEIKGSFNLVNNKDNDRDLLKSINDSLETIAAASTGNLVERECRKFVHNLDNNKSEETPQGDLGNLLNKLSEKPKEKEEEKERRDMNMRCNEDKKNSYIRHDMKDLLRNL